MFWKELHDSPFMMLGLQGVEDSRTRPMTAQVDVPEGGDKDDGGPIYFFGSKSESLVTAMGQTHAARSRPTPARATNCSPTSTAASSSTRTAR